MTLIEDIINDINSYNIITPSDIDTHKSIYIRNELVRQIIKPVLEKHLLPLTNDNE